MIKIGLPCVLIGLFIFGSVFICFNRAKIDEVKLCSPNIKETPVDLPFTLENADTGNYIYKMELRNSFFFSGNIQLIPNSCVTKISVNGIVIPSYFYTNDNCNITNGFYLNLHDYLRSDKNHIIVEIKNHTNKTGLYLKDETYYEKYYILWFIICFSPLLAVKYLTAFIFSLFKKLVIKYRNPILTTLSILGFVLFGLYCLNTFNSRLEIVKKGESTIQLSLPYIFNAKDNGSTTYKITMYNYECFPSLFTFYTNNCIASLTVNGKDATSLIDQDFYEPDYFNNLIKRLVNKGRNEIYVNINNLTQGNISEFIILQRNKNIFIMYFYLLLLLSPLLVRIYNKFLFGKVLAPLFSLALLVWMIYAFTIPYNNYSHDVNGHLQYVHYIQDRQHIPLSNGGFSFYHPALYYFNASVIWNIANMAGIYAEMELNKILQILSLFLFVFYAYFSLKTIDTVFRNTTGENIQNIKKHYFVMFNFIVVCIFLFWPANVIHSIRIGNDIQLYALYATAYYFTVKWYFSKKLKYLLFSLVFTTLAIWTKTNAMLIFAISGLLLCIHFYSDINRNTRYRFYIIQLALIIGFAAVSIYFSFNEKIKNFNHNLNSTLLVGNENKLPVQYKVGNTVSNYVSFNPVKFVEIPFTNTLDDAKGRQSFWQYLFKTSLFGEFSYNKPITMIYAKLTSLFFLLLLPVMLAGIIIAFFEFKTYAPFIISLMILFGSEILFRIISPYVSANDFRFIFPVISIASYFIGITGIQLFKWKKPLGFIIILIPMGFIIFSILFQVSFII